MGLISCNIYTKQGLGAGANFTIGKRLRDLFNRITVSDVRFDFEAKFFQEEMDGFVIHINKIGNEDAVNDVEKINDPLVAAESNLTHAWPPYEPDQMDQCDGHAEILWQMIPEELKEKWKKTIN